MSLKDTLSTYWVHLQAALLPWLDEALDGPLTPRHKQLVAVLGLIRIEALLPSWPGGAPACRTRSSGSRLRRQGGVQLPDHPPADHPTRQRQDVAATVRLAACQRRAERGHLLARLCRVCRQRLAVAAARGADPPTPIAWSATSRATAPRSRRARSRPNHCRPRPRLRHLRASAVARARMRSVRPSRRAGSNASWA